MYTVQMSGQIMANGSAGKRNFKLWGKPDLEDRFVISGAKFKYDTGLAKGSHRLKKVQLVS
jgi:hypothetical protein